MKTAFGIFLLIAVTWAGYRAVSTLWVEDPLLAVICGAVFASYFLERAGENFGGAA